MSPPKRMAEMLFRRDMLGPSVGNAAAAAVSLLLVEKLSMDYLLPHFVPTIEAVEATVGKLGFSLASGAMISVLGFWVVGGLLALPAFFHVEHWKIQVNRSLDIKALWKSLPLIILNFWLGVVCASFAFTALLPESSSNWRQLPSVTILARDIIVWLVVQEVLFFLVHRQFHESKRLYAAIHKIHHTWTAPISIVAIYCHPLEHIASNMAPVILGPVLCGSHLAAIGVYLFSGLVHTTAVHSGYWVCDDNGMHDEHHRQFTVNYGVFGIMDEWYGTFQLPPGAAGVTENEGTRANPSEKSQ